MGSREEEEGGSRRLRWRSGCSPVVLGEVWVVKSCFREKPPGWLSGLPGPFWPLSVQEQGKAARGKDPLPGHLRALEPALKEGHRQRGGRTQADLRELSVCFQQLSG